MPAKEVGVPEVCGPASDVVVAGAGVIGLAAAWRLAQHGFAVTLVDPDVGESASWVAAGMLAPVSESVFGEEDLVRLNLLAVQAFPAFVAELEAVTGSAVGLRTEGTLTVAYDADDRAALHRLSEFRAAIGLRTESLNARECRRLEPFLAAGVQGGALAVDDLSVDNRRYVVALREAALHAGVRTVRSRVASVNVEDGAVAGVRLDDGDTLSAAAVVIAAGCWSGGIDAGQCRLPPIRPVKGQLLRLRLPPGLPPILTHTVRGLVEGREVYLVPRADGEVVVGASVEDRGYDRSTTAGAVHDLLREASSLLPVLAELVLAETCAGLRPGTPDNGPVVGPTGVEGLVMATGHYRNGVLLSPVTAEAVVAAVQRQAMAEQWSPFTPQRFATQRNATQRTAAGVLR